MTHRSIILPTTFLKWAVTRSSPASVFPKQLRLPPRLPTQLGYLSEWRVEENGEGGWEADGRLGIGGDTDELMKDEGQSPFWALRG